MRPVSDFFGRHTVKIDDSIEKRRDLADCLKSLGCPVSLEVKDWYTAGKFEKSLQEDTLMKTQTPVIINDESETDKARAYSMIRSFEALIGVSPSNQRRMELYKSKRWEKEA